MMHNYHSILQRLQLFNRAILAEGVTPIEAIVLESVKSVFRAAVTYHRLGVNSGDQAGAHFTSCTETRIFRGSIRLSRLILISCMEVHANFCAR